MIPGVLLRQTIEVEPYVGEGASGPIFGDPVEYRCRLLTDASWRTLPDGSEETLVEAVAQMRPTATIARGDRATCGGETYRVLRVQESLLLVQASHITVYLGRNE